MGATAISDGPALEKCDKPLGTMVVAEPRAEYQQDLARYSLGSPTALLREMVTQSGCFVILERSTGAALLNGDRALVTDERSDLGSIAGIGQAPPVDFVLNPSLQVANPGTSGIGRRLGGLGAIAGGIKFKEASTTLLIEDARTAVPVAVAEGKAKRTDFSLEMLGVSGGVVSGTRAYTATSEGKLIASSYLDNYNAIVRKLRADPDTLSANMSETPIHPEFSVRG
jgi:curli biogenesis system outer membrane secretion channel CsgG